MAKKILATAAVVVCLAAAAVAVYTGVFKTEEGALKIYGSVDMRTVSPAFEEGGRLASVALEEGDTVKKGEVIAQLDDTRYRIALDAARAAQTVAQKNLDLLLAGSRTEQIDAARARVAASEAALQLSRRTCEREKKLGTATSPLRIDQVCSQQKVDLAQRNAAQKELDLLLAGTRAEELEVARARLASARVQTADAERMLKNCTLTAPADAVVRERFLEAGSMVSAATPVFELALTDPLWVRAYIDEVNLGRIRTGQKVAVFTDSAPGKAFEGTVGFISTVAEFTPKTVQTEELRTSLVYEVRITVADPDGALRLGMPVTVSLGK